jgi:hypothetical protein
MNILLQAYRIVGDIRLLYRDGVGHLDFPAVKSGKVKPLHLRQSAMIQKQKNRLDKVSLVSKKI